MNELAKALTNFTNSEYFFKIIGHTDKRGPDDYNMDLSLRRAKNVMRVIENKNSSMRSRLCAEGKGESELLYQGDSERDNSGNRRVEVKLVKSCS